MVGSVDLDGLLIIEVPSLADHDLLLMWLRLIRLVGRLLLLLLLRGDIFFIVIESQFA